MNFYNFIIGFAIKDSGNFSYIHITIKASGNFSYIHITIMASGNFPYIHITIMASGNFPFSVAIAIDICGNPIMGLGHLLVRVGLPGGEVSV